MEAQINYVHRVMIENSSNNNLIIIIIIIIHGACYLSQLYCKIIHCIKTRENSHVGPEITLIPLSTLQMLPVVHYRYSKSRTSITGIGANNNNNIVSISKLQS